MIIHQLITNIRKKTKKETAHHACINRISYPPSESHEHMVKTNLKIRNEKSRTQQCYNQI